MPGAQHSQSFLGKIALPLGILLGLLLIALLLTDGFGLWRAPPPNAAETPGLVRQGDSVQIPEGSALRGQIGVISVVAKTVSGKLSLPAIVEADPARTEAVLTPLGGRVVDLKVGLGDRVARGQVLAVIDSPDLAQAYDDNDKAADMLRLTGKNLHRQEGQFRLGTASARDLDQARSDDAQAKAEFTRTEARLKAVGAPAGLSRDHRPLVVRAPIGGSITALSVARGAVINDVTQALMTIADLGTIWVTAQVPEADVGAVARGQEAQVSLDAYPGRVLVGSVLFVGDVLEPDTRRDKVRIAFANADYALKPNMFATVTFTGKPQNRLVVPTASLLINNDRTTVFVETAPWVFQRRVVETQLEEGSFVTIDSGLSPGDRVVAKGGILLND